MLLFGSDDAIHPTRNGDHLHRLIWWMNRKRLRIRQRIPDPLMWPSLIVVHDIGLEETVELLLLQDQEMIQTFLPDASQKAFTQNDEKAEDGAQLRSL